MPSPLLIAATALTYVALVLLIWKGGRPERAAGAGLVLAQILSDWLDHLVIGQFRWAVAIISCCLLAQLIWLSLRHDRWWLLFAVGAQFLAFCTHLSSLIGPDALIWSLVTARMTIWAELMLLALFGVWEARRAPYARPKSRPALERGPLKVKVQ
ncbi:hypothetical protein [Brevundimonas sp. SORGH_AS_0993]|uniref:hypothetical protein n=1 Tax=Brevundimonas sp. SORGH_AS_0993 TaxID=3041794 RepID=UPI00278872EC|nr:hypothetical protein [Brevundimonas sp. SORGH_AS_0993]MDQ1154148.1 TM2 domain-containing membrane protein YozV [Brevundimonas sp. SORGH_AS_0993]